MQRSDVVARLRLLLGINATQTTWDTNIQDAILLAQRKLESDSTLPVELLTEAYATTTASTDALGLASKQLQTPTGYLRGYEDGALWYIDSTGGENQLHRVHLDDLRAYYSGTTGAPEVYALAGDQFYIGPAPDGAYTLRYHFYKAAELLDDDTDENIWSTTYSDLLMGEAGLELSVELQRTGEIYERLVRMRNNGYKRLVVNTLSLEMANFEGTMNGG